MGWRAAEDLTHNGIRPFVIDGMVSPKEAVQQFVARNLKSASGYRTNHEAISKYRPEHHRKCRQHIGR